MKTLVLKSPAKVNLFLQVIDKRSDGFHNINTLFQKINLYDELVFAPTSSGKIRIFCDHPQVPKGPKNLVHRVYQCIQKDHALAQGVDIKIHKSIPVAAGLGGGSSNAATALRGLNKLFRLGLSHSELLSYARSLGSDIAFFLQESSWAIGTQKGDVIQPLDIASKVWQVLVVPCVKVYSKKVYEAHNLQLTKTNDNVNILIHNLKKGDINKVGSLINNDLEDAVIRLCPRLLALKQRLKLFDTQGVMISGSGPATLALTRSRKTAEEIAAQMSRRFTRVYVVRTR
jgi:4-diphosphocytidyl-2-C-methyl-D-erythritol kinase